MAEQECQDEEGGSLAFKYVLSAVAAVTAETGTRALIYNPQTQRLNYKK